MANPIMEFIDELQRLRRRDTRVGELELALRRAETRCDDLGRALANRSKQLWILADVSEPRTTDNEF